MNKTDKTTKAKGSMTVAEAGRRGGERVRDTLGSTHFEQIGRKGGEAVATERGSEFYAVIGKRGGDATKAAYGPDHYSEIGGKGGQALAAERGPEHFKQIGKKGGARIKQIVKERDDFENLALDLLANARLFNRRTDRAWAELEDRAVALLRPAAMKTERS